MSSEAQQILTVSGLKVSFHTYAGEVKALDGVDLAVRKGEILGLVGESGCGKSVTSLSIVGLLPPNAIISAGEVLLEGTDILKMSKEGLRKVRATEIAMVFQDPMTYLNPVLTIGSQIQEILQQDPGLFLPDMAASMLEDLHRGKVEGFTKERLEEIRKSAKAKKKELHVLARAYVLKTLEGSPSLRGSSRSSHSNSPAA
jgi:ABC-type dipeptide/oligopeptide/nickel transport system ATPase component